MEPVPFAVIAERAWLDEEGRLNLTGVSDTITVEGFPTAVREFHMVAVFEFGSDDTGESPTDPNDTGRP